MSRPITRLLRGDVVLVSFPFTDFSSQKVRPAIVLSPSSASSDILLGFISSAVKPETLQITDLVIEASHPDFRATGLKKTSVFRMSKLLTVERALIQRRLGRVSSPIQKELDRRLRRATGL